MTALVKGTREEATASATSVEHVAFAETRDYLFQTDTGSSVESVPGRSRTEPPVRVRYGETESSPTRRRLTPITDTKPFEVGPKDQEINDLLAEGSELFKRMLEAEDIIERENLYRTLNERLLALFKLRSSRERTFGHLLVLLLGVTQHTTSEFFSKDQFSALDRAIKLLRKTKVSEPDLKEAERLLSAAKFDLFRPLRGVFDTENA